MPRISEAKKKANKKWNDENLKERYDRIQLVVPKGQKAVIAEAARANGETVNGFIKRLIDAELVRLGWGDGVSGGGFHFSGQTQDKNT